MERLKCPERLKCGHLYCCLQEGLSKDTPVHEACNWYNKYYDRYIRKQKIQKLNEVPR